MLAVKAFDYWIVCTCLESLNSRSGCVVYKVMFYNGGG